MRVFVFAIGGTGSRVLTSLIMQLAAGARPVDSDGNLIKDLSIVPIIVDPHEGNAGLLQATELLDQYRTIHNRIYGKEELPNEGFFSVKIETLKEINPKCVGSDKFFFKMQRVSDNKFDKFIGLNDMSQANKLFCEMLFSKDELCTSMNEGFYGSPNIGCVALNEFKKSPDFEAFRSAYNEGDKLFFIGSIFGGTGASGLPLFISSIRDLAHIENEDGGKDICSKAPIGALIVMPYFSINRDEESPINDSDFLIKTRSALRYYDSNLNRYINNVYYISDPQGTQAFENDPGNVNGQKGNKAHVVEFAGALSIFDFISSDKIGCVEDGQGRWVAEEQSFKAYGLEKDSNIVSFQELSKSTNSLVMVPMMSFYILRNFMENNLLDFLDKPFAKKFEPKIEKSVNSRELLAFFAKYDQWVDEIRSHGSNAHTLDLFNSIKDEYTSAFKNISTNKGVLWGVQKFNSTDLQKKLDKVAEKYQNLSPSEKRWFTIAFFAINEMINEKYDINTLK